MNELEKNILSDDELSQISGGAGQMTYKRICPECRKYTSFLILSKKEAICKNCGAKVEIKPGR